MTYLELVQKAVAESGVVPNAGPPGTATARPASFAAAVGIELKFIAWVQDAWRDIQTAQTRWRWMKRTFTGAITSGGGSTYSATDLDAGLTRVAEWIPITDRGEQAFSAYLTATGVSDELPLIYVPYDEFFPRTRGTQPTADRPTHFTVDPDNEVVFYPAPGGSYTVRGLYLRAPQVMTLDADTPELPTRFHDMIWIGALEKADLYDEASTRYPVWAPRRRGMMAELIRDQLPQMRLAPPLA